MNIHLNGYKGSVIYNGFRFDYDDLFFESRNNNFSSKLDKGKTNLQFARYDDKLVVRSDSLQNSYVNALFGKNWFEEGMMDLFISRKGDIFEGNVNLHQTVLKDVQLVNNLLLFINSTSGDPLTLYWPYLRFSGLPRQDLS